MREEFERWYFSDTGHLAVWVRADQNYNNSDTRQAWRAWQAALLSALKEREE